MCDLKLLKLAPASSFPANGRETVDACGTQASFRGSISTQQHLLCYNINLKSKKVELYLYKTKEVVSYISQHSCLKKLTLDTVYQHRQALL